MRIFFQSSVLFLALSTQLEAQSTKVKIPALQICMNVEGVLTVEKKCKSGKTRLNFADFTGDETAIDPSPTTDNGIQFSTCRNVAGTASTTDTDIDNKFDKLTAQCNTTEVMINDYWSRVVGGSANALPSMYKRELILNGTVPIGLTISVQSSDENASVQGGIICCTYA